MLCFSFMCNNYYHYYAMRMNALASLAFAGIHAFHITEVHSDHKSPECINFPRKQHWNQSMCGKKFELCASSYFLVGWLCCLGLLTQCDYRFSRFSGRDPHCVIHKLNWMRFMITGIHTIRTLLDSVTYAHTSETLYAAAKKACNSSNCEVN